MEQGPDELSDSPDERADDLERLTDKPLDDEQERDSAGEPEVRQSDNLETVDPGL